jgi:hypothetical protein
MTMLQRGGEWPIIVPHQYDIDLADKQTFRTQCVCGALLDLAHMQDLDSYDLWYGGICGQCGYGHHVEVDGDTLHCRTCDTPLQFVSDRKGEEQMYCPKCDPKRSE